MLSDPHKVVDRTQRSDVRPIAYRHMTAKCRSVRHDGVATNLAVVRNMDIRHDQIAVAYLRQTSALNRSTIDGHKLANFVVITNLQTRGLTFVRQILRCHTNRAEGKDPLSAPIFVGPSTRHVRNQMASLSHFYLGPNHAIGPNFAGRVNLGLRVNNRRGMNAHDDAAGSCLRSAYSLNALSDLQCFSGERKAARTILHPQPAPAGFANGR